MCSAFVFGCWPCLDLCFVALDVRCCVSVCCLVLLCLVSLCVGGVLRGFVRVAFGCLVLGYFGVGVVVLCSLCSLLLFWLLLLLLFMLCVFGCVCLLDGIFCFVVLDIVVVFVWGVGSLFSS